MKQIIISIILVFSIVCEAQKGVVHNFNEINLKDVIEIKGVFYLKKDTTLVTGKVMRFNRKNEAKKYLIVVDGKPDNQGWIKLNNREYYEPKENVLASVLSSVLATPENGFNIPNQPNHSPGDYEKYIKEKTSRNFSNMHYNYIDSKKLNSENEILIVPIEENSKDGQPNIISNSINDKRNGNWEAYHQNGKIKIKGFYVDGKEEGLWEAYYENGQLNYRGKFIEGIKDGLWEAYYPNGQLKSKGKYKEGKYFEGWSFYNEQGKVILMEFYN
ncbi:toxin-antitoxin system YwqK family antitoxin [Mariniflexile sp. HNIBRBA6329]|uniref:toxin-antitoxin system YwqK family antitoxin n=1 Tax=Mariniflexile sp. HNIBRBA6329 TaxID=3373088 RepID=UPI0037474477